MTSTAEMYAPSIMNPTWPSETNPIRWLSRTADASSTLNKIKMRTDVQYGLARIAGAAARAASGPSTAPAARARPRQRSLRMPVETVRPDDEQHDHQREREDRGDGRAE